MCPTYRKRAAGVPVTPSPPPILRVGMHLVYRSRHPFDILHRPAKVVTASVRFTPRPIEKETAMMCRTIVVGVALSICWRFRFGRPMPDKAKARSKLVVPARRSSPRGQALRHQVALVGADSPSARTSSAAIRRPGRPTRSSCPTRPSRGRHAGRPPDQGEMGRQRVSATPIPGEIDLGETEHAVIYAVAWLDCPEAITDAKLLTGSDDYIKVWINGKLVHTYNTECRAGEADQDTDDRHHAEQGREPDRRQVRQRAGGRGTSTSASPTRTARPILSPSSV